MKKWVVSENKKSLTYVGTPLVESINGHITKSKDGYNAFISETFIGTYADSEQAKTAVELNVGDKIYEAGLLSMVGDKIAGGAKKVVNKTLGKLGSAEAQGRYDLQIGTDKLMKDWGIYCGREKATGNLRPSQAPTLADLSDFFGSQYGMQLTPDQLKKVIGSSAPAEEKPTEPTDPSKPTEPTDPSKPKTESVIMELDKPEDVRFNPKVVFKVLANALIKQGVLKVGDDGPTGDPYSKSGSDEAIKNQEANGMTINMRLYKKWLEKYGENQKTMSKLIRKLNNNATLKKEEAIQPYRIVIAFSSSIVKPETISDKSKNITASNHTIDMKEFFATLEKSGLETFFLKLLQQIKRKTGEDEKIEILTNAIGDNKAEILKLRKLARTMLNSFVEVEKEQKE